MSRGFKKDKFADVYSTVIYALEEVSCDIDVALEEVGIAKACARKNLKAKTVELRKKGFWSVSEIANKF